MTDTRHPCPGQCGRTVAHTMLACRDDWNRLPHNLRVAVMEANILRRKDPGDNEKGRAHRALVAEALAWYRANPGGVA